MAYVESDALMTRSDFIRWSAATAVVLALHAFAAFILSNRADNVDDDAGAPVVIIELAPLSVAPSPPSDLAPGPPKVEPEVQERAKQEPKREQKEPDPIHTPDDVTAPNPVVELPRPAPEQPKELPKEEREDKVREEPQQKTPVPTAQPSAIAPAARAAAPAVGRVARLPAAAVASWQRSLIAHLERHKRYPPQARPAQGVTTLAFSIDRAGHVVSSRIAHTSGSTLLDRETLAMIKRAQPLPRPPSEMSGEQFSFTVPVRFLLPVH
jgi:protein TonB